MTPTENTIYVRCHQTRLTASAVLATLGVSFNGLGDYLERRSRSQHIPQNPRPCINCGKEHDHNNAFCSSDCCRAYRARKATP